MMLKASGRKSNYSMTGRSRFNINPIIVQLAIIIGALVDIDRFASANDVYSPPVGQHEPSLSSLNFLLAPAYFNGNKTIEHVLERIAPNLRQLRDFTSIDHHGNRDYATSIDLSLGAWKLMRNQAQQVVSRRLEILEPILIEFLNDAKVSSECLQASRRTIEAGKRFESWAIQLFSAWASFPPSGLFEGTWGDLGSYHGCLRVPENRAIKHAHYCSISFRPLMPQRADFELIFSQVPGPLLNLFGPSSIPSNGNSSSVDAFADLVSLAQYFHYIFIKLGTCCPIDCSPRDVQKVAKLIGHNWSLQIGPVKCNSKFDTDYVSRKQTTTTSDLNSHIDGLKQQETLQISTTRDLNEGVYIWKPHMTDTQYWALIILGSIISILVSATLLDLALNQLPALRAYLKQLRCEKHHDEHSSNQANENEYGGRISNGTSDSSGSSDWNTPKTATSHELNVLHQQKIYVENNNNGDNDYVISHHDNNNNNESKSLKLAHFEQAQKNNLNIKPCKIYQSNRRPNIGVRKRHEVHGTFRLFVRDLSLIENGKEFLRIDKSERDIGCINGIRCLTMIWIIIAHTMQYNDWSAFARAIEVEVQLRSLITQPLFNGSYLVDTFFVVSGLLTSYTIFNNNKLSFIDIGKRFTWHNYLLGRYLRLTPQIVFVNGLFILLPLTTNQYGSPHWYTMTGEYSEFCTRNWWINVFHLQAFYKSSEMCNFASWWVSVDSFFHLISLIVLLMIFYCGQRYALKSCLCIIALTIAIQFGSHYYLRLPPNMLSTIPQTDAMFSTTTLYFFWNPVGHAMPFFLGLLVGYMIAREGEFIKAQLNWPRALIIWSCITPVFILVTYATYFYIVGKWSYKHVPLLTACFSVLCTLFWSVCLIWTIVACKFNYGGPIDRILSCSFFTVLSKASYLVYLSHFLILFSFFGSQNLLLEPSQLMMTYVTVGNIIVSMLFGCLLCVGIEMPWLKMQKRIMRMLNANGRPIQARTQATPTTITAP